ncbi:MAG: ornithine carbamoyltransferase [Terriglobia bacterium]
MTAAPLHFPRIVHGDLTKDSDLTEGELLELLDLAAAVKQSPEVYRSRLAGKSIALLFEKPSLRTRMTFELAIQQLGGYSIFTHDYIGSREPLKDVARNLDRWVNAIVARTYLQATVDDLARWARVPVINALSDTWHPCQALADMLTIREHFGTWRGNTVAFIGDGNNVAQSLMLNSVRLGMDFILATPAGYESSPEIVSQARTIAARTNTTITVTNDAAEAARDAQVIYTDTWVSMGSESEESQRHAAFRSFQVDEKLFNLAEPRAIFMHCLPAHRGDEVTDSVMESPRSVVFDQAENRLHAQKALLLMLLDETTNS